MSLPYEITDVPEEINKELWSAFKGRNDKYVQIGPKKYLLSEKFREIATEIYNMPIREDDVWVNTFPRSGTTWTQEMTWLINNDLDYERAIREKLDMRFPLLELKAVVSEAFIQQLVKLNNWGPENIEEFRRSLPPNLEFIRRMSSPRHIKTHLPLSLLPPKLLDTCKVIYVARNPKDAAVSGYYYESWMKIFGYRESFKQYWNLFQRGLVPWAPHWDHVMEAWNLRNHPNLLFLFYEDLKKDLQSSLHKIARFLNKPLTDDQIPKLMDHLKIDSFRKNPTFTKNRDEINGFYDPDKPGFFRQGKSGSWRSEFSEEMNAKADEWIKEHEKETDLRFQF